MDPVLLYRYPEATVQQFEEAVHHLEAHDHKPAPSDRKPLAMDIVETWTRLRRLQAENGNFQMETVGDIDRLLIGAYCPAKDLTLIFVVDKDQSPNGEVLVCFHNRKNMQKLMTGPVYSVLGEHSEFLELEEGTYAHELLQKLRGQRSPELEPKNPRNHEMLV